MLVCRYWAMFVKYDPIFNVQWSGSWIELHNGAVEGLADGSVLFADTANVVRFAPTGTITWSIALQPAYGYIRGMALRPDGRLLLAGAHPDGYAWLTELDPDGVVDWSFRYGDPGDSYVPEEMLLMPDGGIRIVGTAGLAPARPWVMALDSTGALGSCSYPAFAPQFFATTLTPWEAVNTGFEGTGLYTCSLATTAQNSYIPTEQSCTGGGLALAGRVFHDADLDGIWSTGEACFPYIMVGMQPEALMSMTTTGCDYQFLTTVPGAHTVAPIPLNPWWDLSTDSSSSTVQYNGGDSTIVGQDFGFTPAYDTTVLTGTLITAPILCSTWFNTSTMGALHVLNTGTTTPDVVVGLTLDSLLSLVSSEPAPDSIVGQTAYWHLNAIGFFNIADIDMQLHSTAWSDDTLHSTGYLLNPLDPADTLGTFTWSSPVLCAYDPNDKLVAPSGNIAPEQDWLTYTVRFQNTGTAAAANVMIQDQLSLLVDPASLHYLGSSHDVTDIHVGSAGLAEFRFDNIQLPDSGADEPGSHGHITFRVRPLPGLHHLDSITNDAAIFFDLNAPVITNVVLSRVINCAETTWEAMLFDNGDGVLWGGVDMSGAFTYTYQWLLNGEPLVGEMMMSITPEVSGSYQVMQTDQYGCARTSEQLTFVLTGIAEPGRNMFIAPNPMSDVAHVVFSEPLSSDARMELVDVHGRVVRTMNGKGSRQVLIERGHLESGIYVVRLISDHGQLGAVRLVVD